MINKKDPKTPEGRYYKKVVFYEDEFHDRHVTIAVLLNRSSSVYMGMSICCPMDKTKRELGRHIAQRRAEARFDTTSSSNSKCKRVICSPQSLDSVLRNDKFFLKQIGRSFFYDFKSNPKKYIASYEA